MMASEKQAANNTDDGGASGGGDSTAAKRLVFMGHQRQPFYMIESHPMPELKPGQILAKIRLATICGSDIHTITGRRIEATPR